LSETEILVKREVTTIQAMEEAAIEIVHDLGAQAVVVTGGHLQVGAIDIFYDGNQIHHLTSERFNTIHTHGTGCTFSAVITAELAKGKTILEAVKLAKAYITDAIRYSLKLGKGNGPTNHWGYRLKGLPNERGDSK